MLLSALKRNFDLFQRIREYRTGLAKLRGMYWVPVPLAYVQVVFLAVRIYLVCALFGRQFIHTDRYKEFANQVG
jgi:hypothetical protein